MGPAEFIQKTVGQQGGRREFRLAEAPLNFIPANAHHFKTRLFLQGAHQNFIQHLAGLGGNHLSAIDRKHQHPAQTGRQLLFTIKISRPVELFFLGIIHQVVPPRLTTHEQQEHHARKKTGGETPQPGD